MITIESRKTGLRQQVSQDTLNKMNDTLGPGRFIVVPNDETSTPPEAKTAKTATKTEAETAAK